MVLSREIVCHGSTSAVPSQNEISDQSFNLKATTSLGIRLSRGGKETSLVAFFGLENVYQCCYTLKCRPSPSKYSFTTFTLPREKKTPELLLDALLHYSKTTVQQMNFFVE